MSNPNNNNYSPDDSEILVQTPNDVKEFISPDDNIEYFPCQKCGEFNAIRKIPMKRRVKKTRHIKADQVTWSSLKRFAVVNNIDMNYALQLLLHTARTSNINYIINDKELVEQVKNVRKIQTHK